MWTNQIQDTLNFKKRGDSAFIARDFSTAIDYYTQVSQLNLTLPYQYQDPIYVVHRRRNSFKLLFLCSSSTGEPWYHRLCTQGAAYATWWTTWRKKHLETRCKLNRYLRLGLLHSIFKQLHSLALAWTMMHKRVSKMGQHWKLETIEIETVYSVYLFSLPYLPTKIF